MSDHTNLLAATADDRTILSVTAGIGVLRVDSPPVNALGIAVRRGLLRGLETLSADEAVRAIVIICGGRTFFAGADIGEFGRPMEQPDLRRVLDFMESCPKPLIAAIHGTALGGGLELALVCHHRIAVPSAQVGLPEVKLGLLPGAGGTQRLPRIVGVEKALDLMTSGRSVKAPEALELGILDALTAEGRLEEDALAFAAKIVAAGGPTVPVSRRDDRIAEARANPEIFTAFAKKHERSFRGFKAPGHIIEAVRGAVSLPFAQGMARELELFRELERSTESAAQRYVFFAERKTSKIPDVPSDTPTIPIRRVGVIGAGTMGGGIAMNFLNAGIPLTLVERNEAALERGMGVMRRNYENSAARGRMTAGEVEERMALITPALDMAALADADLIIEAVFEEMEIKKQVFAELDRVAHDGAILASNTSFLNLDEIAAVTSRPQQVIGLHFFSPANVMRLLEVVRGERTSPALIATAFQLARKIGKVPVLSRVCHGFIANRVMVQRSRQADAVILEGPTPEEVDKVLYDYGFPMGEFQMMDLVGLDVVGREETERSVAGDLVQLGRLGQKQNGGYYDYDEKRRPTSSPVALKVIEDVARHKGIDRKGPQDAEDILTRLLYPVVNEGAKLLDEGVALRASDIDIAVILGYGWPVHTGGPMFWADTVGLGNIVTRLRALEKKHGPTFTPSPLLERMAADGASFTRD